MKLFFFLFCFCAFPVFAGHGLALHGEPKLPQGFKHFDYVNPNAPKKGHLTNAMSHGFDTLNPFSINGIAPSGIFLTHDTLMKQNANEAFTQYGLIAQEVFLSKNKKTVTFKLNPNARFNDNSPITAEDVLFSFNTLKEKGLPIYRVYYQDVEKATIVNPHTIQFTLKTNKNKELPLILGQLPVLSKNYWQNKDFEKTTMQIPVTSGPYLIQKITPNRSITYQRNPNYWAKDLNVNQGFYNFDTIQYDTYLDSTVTLEALRKGMIDLHQENVAKRWQNELQWPQLKDGTLTATQITHQLPSGMQGFVFNLRNPLFQDIKVRQALTKVLDFEWINQNLFYNMYQRTTSYFDNSYLKAPPLPSKEELGLLKPYESDLPSNTLTTAFELKNLPPRQALREALDLLEQAGWSVQNNILQKEEKPFQFTLLLDANSAQVWERIALPFVARLKRLGIQADIQVMDLLQYKNKIDNFEYDMIVFVWGNSLSPGNEQMDYWGSQAAQTKGSTNLTGIQNKAIDAIIEKIKNAQTKQELITATHALDRVLLHHYLVIPHWYSATTRLIHKPDLQRPKTIPMNGLDLMTWWKK